MLLNERIADLRSCWKLATPGWRKVLEAPQLILTSGVQIYRAGKSEIWTGTCSERDPGAHQNAPGGTRRT